MVTVLITRHGQTSWNASKRKQGWAPIPLNEQGKAESRQLGRHLERQYDIDVVYYSDLLRSVQTIEGIRETASVPDDRLYVEKRLRERNLGVLQGLGPPLLEKYARYFLPDGGEDAVENRPENGESYLDLQDRVLNWWRDTVDEETIDEDWTVLVVTHGGVLITILAHVLGINLVEGFEIIDNDNCSINRIEYYKGEAEVVARNETGFLSI